jgi:hypothetical protein
MRYLPGTVVVSPEADLPLLRTVHRAGHVTLGQLYASVHHHQEKRLWDSLSWRISRLVKGEFLDRTQVAGLKGSILSLGENGELYLQSREQFLVERAARSRGSNKRHQIWHDVELFDIQLALRRAGVIVVWESEPEVKAANDFTTDRYAKDYDAVVTFRSGSKSGKVALEYERTPKWSKEYERICTVLDHEQKVGAVLYLAPNLELRSFLLHALRNARRRIVVALVAEFVRDPQSAHLIDVRTQFNQRLEDCLAERPL